MTIYGIDISEHQDGLALRKARTEGIEFVIIRLCDGTYRDRTFHSHLEDAERNGLLVSTYWYLRAPSEGTSIAQQVDVIDRQMGGRRDLGVWIDVESVDRNGRKLLTAADVNAAKQELERRGYYVPGIYTGRWYWELMPGGEPSMAGLGNLWVSHYGHNRVGAPRATYEADGGDQHPGWAYPLGDRRPDLLQFGSNGIVAGGYHPVDVNAYRGTRDQLAALFNPPAKAPAPAPRKETPVAFEKVLPYPRTQITQETGYWCGPASAQTIIFSTGTLVQEAELAKKLRTHRGGTDWIGQFPDVLNEYIDGADYVHVEMPNDPPTREQKEKLWRDLCTSIDAGHGVVINIVAPPNNYPRAVDPSKVQPAYGPAGSWVYHYVAGMGVGQDADGTRRVWIADSGFPPYGYWISLDQLSTLIPPKGYAYSKTKAPAPLTGSTKSTTPGGFLMALSDAEQRELLDKTRRVHHELTHTFQSRYEEHGERATFKDTLVGYLLEADRKLEDIHKNMLPAIWRRMARKDTSK